AQRDLVLQGHFLAHLYPPFLNVLDIKFMEIIQSHVWRKAALMPARADTNQNKLNRFRIRYYKDWRFLPQFLFSLFVSHVFRRCRCPIIKANTSNPYPTKSAEKPGFNTEV